MNNINFAHLGNGISVYDTERPEVNGDYPQLAWISPERNIEWKRKDLKENEVFYIIHYSMFRNPPVSISEPNYFVFKTYPMEVNSEEYFELLKQLFNNYKKWKK